MLSLLTEQIDSSLCMPLHTIHPVSEAFWECPKQSMLAGQAPRHRLTPVTLRKYSHTASLSPLSRVPFVAALTNLPLTSLFDTANTSHTSRYISTHLS